MLLSLLIKKVLYHMHKYRFCVNQVFGNLKLLRFCYSFFELLSMYSCRDSGDFPSAISYAIAPSEMIKLVSMGLLEL